MTDGPPADPKRLYRQLAGEPFLLRIDEIAGLTDAQIVVLYMREEDDTPDVSEMTPEQQRDYYIRAGRRLGIPAEKLQKAWDDGQRTSAGRSEDG